MGNTLLTMEIHHPCWENSLFLWPLSIAMLNYKRAQTKSLIWKIHRECRSCPKHPSISIAIDYPEIPGHSLSFDVQLHSKSDPLLGQSPTGWWFRTCFLFPSGNVIIPIDFHSNLFQRGQRVQPPTSKCYNHD